MLILCVCLVILLVTGIGWLCSRASARRYPLAQRLLPVAQPVIATALGAAPHGESIASGNRAMIYYRTRDGRADYGFAFERQADGSYRVYIISQPDYGGRADDAHATHRLTDGGRRYICWQGKLRTEDQARQVAALWADNTQQYIRSGRRF